jgi:AraC-like DNA-binding protein
MAPTISGKALRAPIFAAAARTGDPPPALAALVGIPPAVAVAVDARVEHDVVVRAWDVLSAHARDPHLGLFAVELLDAAPLDLVDIALSSSRDLRSLITAYTRYQRLFHDANDSSLRLEDDVAIVTFALKDVPRSRHLSEFVIGAWKRRMQRLVGARFEAIEVRLRDAADPHPLFARVFGAPVRFAADEDAIVLPAALLAAPLAGADTSLQPALERHLEQALAARASPPSFVEQAAACLRAELGRAGARPTARTLAKALHISSRTLQRRLEETGTSFRGLLDDALRELALAHLERPDTSVTEVAFLLGFSDLSAFSRAFRRWTGVAPGDHRRGARRDVR